MNRQEQHEASGALASAKETIPAADGKRRKGRTRLRGLALLLAGGALICGSAVQAATTSGWDTSGWPHRTARERSAITTVADTHETVLVLDLLRQGRREKAEDVLFAMLGLRLLDIENLNTGKVKPFSPGEERQLCRELGPITELENSKMFESMAHRHPKQAAYLRADIATLKKNCAAL